MAITNISELPAYTPPAEEGQQQIISTQPQDTSEVNVMDYLGVQAASPTLQPSTQLAPQVIQQEVQPGEIQTTPLLAPEAPQVAYTQAPVAVAPQPVVAPVATAGVQEAEVVAEPELSKTSAVQTYEKVAQEADALQAAQLELGNIDPRATVQGQLAQLQEQFKDGTPIWAQGAMREVSALMAQRGLGSSSVAAEAITNALMQSAIPIAQQDASFYQTVSMQNLSNEQQTEMTKFNARLSSLFNDQAATNTANNINAASANDLAQFYSSLSQNVVLTNASAYNAMEQFNATATNQSNQFVAELGLQADKINVDALNEMAQFNTEQVNNLAQFNASMKNNREQFNVQNQIAIDASNVQWRRDVNTANTATTNAAIQADVQNLLGIQQTSLNNIWNHYDTLLNMAFKAEESALDRAANLAIAAMQEEMRSAIQSATNDSNLISSIFQGGSRILASDSGWDTVSGWFS